MAIRMRPDDNGGNDRPRIPNQPNRPRQGGGGMGMLTMFLPMIFSMFRKNPKMGVILLIIGALLYFGTNIFSGGGGDPNVVSPYQESLGFTSNPEKYGNTSVYEPLADNRKNPLPEKVSLLEYTPTRLNQGRQGSCVGWSSAYGARTILYARQTGENPNNVTFSPSYLYNQIALPRCQGTYLPDALEVMKKGGTLPFEEFAYDESSCSKKPTSGEKQKAGQYRIRDYHRLTEGRSSNQKPNMLGIKQNLAAGAPVVIGMMVGGTFMRDMEGKDLWVPTKREYQMNGFGGHAMCVIGYDDYKGGGAFQIMNSWGENWGNKGIGWVRYQDFYHFTKEAYGLYPMGNAKGESDRFEMEFGLVKNKGKVNVAFEKSGEHTFRTVTPLKKDEDFKIEVTNSVNCYTYVFSQEVDGTIFTLFPYNEKHSPYCGVKGTRVFPRFESLYPDDQGNLDYMGVIITKEPVNYDDVKNALNQAQGTMAQKMKSIIGGDGIKGLSFNAGKSVQMETNSKEGGATYIVLEIDKK